MFWCGVFALAYAQSPLFTSNQNQYFLHGLARAGFGYLAQDWTANTIEPTPLFSLLVEGMYRLTGGVWLSYWFYALLMGIYVFSLYEIASTHYPLRDSLLESVAFLSVILLLHSAAWREVLSRGLGENWAYLLEDGVADQRLLGPVFQPSTLGVLLLLSIVLFLRGHWFWAVLSLVSAASFHPTYLLSAACLTIAFMLESYRQQRKAGKVLAIGGAALLGVVPILSYVWINFTGTSPKIAAKAQYILAYFRIPHHALPLRWLDATVAVKLVLIFLAVYLVRRHRMFLIMVVPLVVGFLGTLAQMATGNQALALLFPWRISTWLVPLSLTVIVGWLLEGIFRRRSAYLESHARLLSFLLISAVVGAAVVGVVRFKLEVDRENASVERGVFSFVQQTLEPGQIYLIPVKMLDFRLETGAPAFIDFKTPPYKDTEVLEWYRRIQLAQRFYRKPTCDLAQRFVKREGVTHIILPAERELSCPQFTLLFDDGEYRVLLIH